MEPHRPRSGTRASASGSSPSSARTLGRKPGGAPLDEEWLEQAALRYAAKWETTEKGVCDALARKLATRCAQSGEDAEALLDVIPSIAARLVARGYVDDRRFATQLAARLERQGRSHAYVVSKLQVKGVSEAIIEDILSDAGPDAEQDAAWRIARKRRLGPYCLDPEKRTAQRDKQLGVLARQGFDLDLATRIIDADAPPEEA